MAALILSVNPDLLWYEVGSIIAQSSPLFPIPSDQEGYGTIDAFKALSLTNGQPAAPQNLTIKKVKVGSVYYPRLSWNANAEPDMESYNIYRWIDIDPPGYILKGNVSHPGNVFIDTSVPFGSLATAYYYVKGVDAASLESDPSNTVYIGVNYASKPIIAAELESIQDPIPNSFTLAQNHPNPFNPTTTIRYGIPVDAHVSINVHDVLGKNVASLVDGFVSAGYHEVSLDGSSLASGIYFYRIKAGTFTEVKRLVLLK